MGLWDFLAGTTPAGVASSVAGSVISEVANGIDKIIRDFKLPPEQMVAYETRMKELEAQASMKLEELATSDRASARQRELALAAAGSADYTPKILAYSVTFGFFAVLFYMMAFPVPAGVERVVDVLLGSLGMAWISIVTYYFGSSSGSAAKSKILSDMGKGA